ncbi:Holliday junction endonuclease RuvC [Syntrophobacter fumaroxidans MPOB]|uniref:Crossover junction endodeoxyribonuclease RuvC n=1 Tax=Syntrophobacter fumaroxidans (strain DSM 10017 / MPOB) TaxID=335543 RepID=A0LGY8_SYNFM|nr:Holliday junction endonuclease RuvC [Syntrophobacter fumaroxidans MPOB]
MSRTCCTGGQGRKPTIMIRTIGVDPGSRFTGYGIVEGEGTRLLHVANGVIRLSGELPLTQRLKLIYEQLTRVIAEVGPECMAIEDIFFAKNVKSALRLGQARGAAILAGVNAGLPIYEYSALEVKKAVVGYGKAGKDQVGEMVRCLFRLSQPIDPNAADALAVAVCHVNTSGSRTRWIVRGKS